ncbi:hypothetical protein BDV93DRAFT_504498 [Ceratobasidium sp. AG-I]|nr:hypothetical protein BDV93DRAFT_504498 [Ceratobasidium sp. AG-I]
MSHSQQSTNDSERDGSRSNIEQFNEAPNQLPAFQSFPAARNVQPRPTPGYQAASAPAADDVNVHGSRHGTAAQELLGRQRQRTVTLPAFTPFPAASPSSRYAPPEGARAAPPRPIPTPPLSADLPNYPGEGIRYPSNLIPGQPSPFAPPGPLTARPHVCEHCETGFARAHDLKRHMDTHKAVPVIFVNLLNIFPVSGTKAYTVTAAFEI